MKCIKSVLIEDLLLSTKNDICGIMGAIYYPFDKSIPVNTSILCVEFVFGNLFTRNYIIRKKMTMAMEERGMTSYDMITCNLESLYEFDYFICGVGCC